MLSPEVDLAFLTTIASFRAVNGSYSLLELRDLCYQRSLNNLEWEACLNLYDTKLQTEKERNDDQKKRHEQIKATLQSRIEQLKKIVSAIPEIVDVWIVNSYTFGALKPTSDIDLLVITHPQAIWWARLKLTAALERAGLRRKPGDVEEQFCLSFFITTNNLDMSTIAGEDDIHFAYWAVKAEPLFPERHIAWLNNNAWLKDFFPYKYAHLPNTSEPTIKALSPFSYLMNHIVRVPMRMRSTYKASRLGADSSIIINDNMLKFHNIDRRALYKELTKQELSQLQKMVQN